MSVEYEYLLNRRISINYRCPFTACENEFSSTSDPSIVLDPWRLLLRPGGFVMDEVSGGILFNWDVYPGAICYSLYRAIDALDSFSEYVLVTECTENTSIFILGAEPGTYVITAITPTGETEPSSPVSTAPPPPVPLPPAPYPWTATWARIPGNQLPESGMVPGSTISIDQMTGDVNASLGMELSTIPHVFLSQLYNRTSLLLSLAVITEDTAKLVQLSSAVSVAGGTWPYQVQQCDECLVISGPWPSSVFYRIRSNFTTLLLANLPSGEGLVDSSVHFITVPPFSSSLIRIEFVVNTGPLAAPTIAVQTLITDI